MNRISRRHLLPSYNHPRFHCLLRCLAGENYEADGCSEPIANTADVFAAAMSFAVSVFGGDDGVAVLVLRFPFFLYHPILHFLKFKVKLEHLSRPEVQR